MASTVRVELTQPTFVASVPYSAGVEIWSLGWDLNPRSTDYESVALGRTVLPSKIGSGGGICTHDMSVMSAPLCC
jgi:hypothetical protein